MKKQKSNKKVWLILAIIGIIALLLGVFFDKLTTAYEDEKERLENKLIQIKGSYELQIENLNLNHSKEIENITQFYESEKRELQERIKNSEALEFKPRSRLIRTIIWEDDTYEKEYDEDDFNCVDYSHRLIQFFRREGIYSCMVTLYFDDGAHAIVSVDTKEDGIIYIEPQNNKIIYSLNVGDDYCDIVNWDCNWKIEKIKFCFDNLK